MNACFCLINFGAEIQKECQRERAREGAEGKVSVDRGEGWLMFPQGWGGGRQRQKEGTETCWDEQTDADVALKGKDVAH